MSEVEKEQEEVTQPVVDEDVEEELVGEDDEHDVPFDEQDVCVEQPVSETTETATAEETPDDENKEVPQLKENKVSIKERVAATATSAKESVKTSYKNHPKVWKTAGLCLLVAGSAYLGARAGSDD